MLVDDTEVLRRWEHSFIDSEERDKRKDQIKERIKSCYLQDKEK